MKNKVVLFLTIMSFLFGLTTKVSAENFSVPAIYIVDMDRVLDKSKIGMEAVKKVKNSIAESEKIIAPKRAEVEAGKKELEKQAGLLSEKAFQEKQSALVAKNQAFQEAMAAEQKKVGKVRDETLSAVVAKARKAIEDVSKENSYALVVEKGSPAVLYAGGATDITDKIIAKIGG
jgi:Skp family chaperone for outer membrane proteins